ncbi:MAG TPA: S8 family serine peptidase [Actinomycetota bacterium]|jgi:subtilisin family serine protease
MGRNRLLLVLALMLVTGLTAIINAPAARSSATGTFIVLWKNNSVPADAAATIQKAGGSLVHSYSAIGVAVARSDSPSFRDKLLAADKSIEGAAATGKFGVQAFDEGQFDQGEARVTPNTPAPGQDNLSGLQWDMEQIHVWEAHEIEGGDPSVVVGDVDTGLDFTHPDIAPNYDAANSVDCSSGAPQPLLPDNDQNGHGTHTAGTVAAALNQVGIVGVAPNVKIAGIKSSNDDGFFFPEMVVCSFMWVASHNIAVTNNSYFADPWLFNCLNDPEQRAIWKAESRAIEHAISRGTVVVAASGNFNQDLSKQNIDEISPDFPPGEAERREVTNACKIVPVEVPGVIGVNSDGNLLQKAYYSNYGVGVSQVIAPGGDRRFQVTPKAPNGRVLSTWPRALFDPSNPLMLEDCSVSPCATYAYLQGTSMASPHVAGVAALVKSIGISSPGAVTARINGTADSHECPPNPFNPGPPFDFEAHCAGGTGYNGFYGHGQVNALRAVS